MTYLASPTVVIACLGPVNWFDVRKVAQALLGVEDVTATDMRATHFIRWVGSDANNRPDRHLEIRKRGGKWRRV